MLERAETITKGEGVTEPSIMVDREGRPEDQIINTADEVRAELIMMGCRGLGAVKSVLLGNVSAKVIHRTTIPCLIVP